MECAGRRSIGSSMASSSGGRTFQNCFLEQSGHRRERCRLGTVHGVAYYHSSCWYGSWRAGCWSTAASASFRQAMPIIGTRPEKLGRRKLAREAWWGLAKPFRLGGIRDKPQSTISGYSQQDDRWKVGNRISHREQQVEESGATGTIMTALHWAVDPGPRSRPRRCHDQGGRHGALSGQAGRPGPGLPPSRGRREGAGAGCGVTPPHVLLDSSGMFRTGPG